jgi:CheY-like chemotaxis protein
MTQLHQVLMNLLNNAQDAVEATDTPLLTISLDLFRTDNAFLETHAYFNAGRYAHLSVKENGCGIPEHQLQHLFEPFFTTKEEGKGTGLGLAMVFGAIKTHHGFFEVESIEGAGSTFHLYFPLVEAVQKASVLQQGSNLAEEGHGELILLADDEQHVRETGKDVLEDLGYRVLTAQDGQQAVELFEAHSKDIDLCIFDVVMPVLDGDKAAKCIRLLDHKVKIIFATGYDKNRLDNAAHETMLSKPFAIEEMSRLVREVLDR